MKNLNPLITPKSLHEQLPLSPMKKKWVNKNRKSCEALIQGKDKRLIVFTGPCSIHNPEIAIEYAYRLKELSTKISKQIFLIMRVFLEKPRTQFGWKGFLYDPFLDGSHEIEYGLTASRKLLLNLVTIGVPIATEFLDPILPTYNQDIITWGIIGARSSASQIHRQFASQLPMPIGFKNETNGDYDNAICGILSARFPQLSLCINEEGQLCSIKTNGNPFTHLILRGSKNQTNYDPISVSEAIHKQQYYGLNARLIIDCAHGNSRKKPKNQQHVFFSALEQINQGNNQIMGMMIESHLQGGNALSITDPCLDWDSTKQLLIKASQILENPLKNFAN